MPNTDGISLSSPIDLNESIVTKPDYGLGLIALFLLVNIIFILSKGFEWLSPEEITIVGDSNSLAMNIFTVLMLFQVVRHQDLEARTKRAWKIVTFAYLSYTIGTTFWFYYSSMIGEKAFPSNADFFYWGFYPLMFWALMSFPITPSTESNRKKLMMDIAIIMLGGSTAVWHFIVQPTLANMTEGDLLPIFLNLSYTVGDLVLMLGIATILMRPVAENSRKALYIIIVALIVLAFADFGYAYTTLQNTYTASHWINSVFHLGYIIFAFAGHYQYKQLSKPVESKEEVEEQQSIQSFSWLPYMAILLACIMLLVVTQPYWSDPMGLIIFASIGITVLVVFRQVTAVKENIRLLKEQAERQSELRFRALVENSSDMLTIRDEMGKVIFRSPSIKNILGYELEELEDKNSHELIHPDDVEKLEKSYAKLTNNEIQSFKMEYRSKHKDGSWRVLEGIAKTFEDEVNNLKGILVNSRDVTQRKQSEEKLRLYTTKLEQSNRELQDFAYVASHDLQEPLRKVQAFGDRLNRKYGEKLGEEGSDYVKRMRGAATRMQTLIEGLLEFSRVSTKANPFEKTDLNKVCREVISDLEVKIEQTQAKIKVSELPFIEADELQMRQLLQNLIGNSLKFQQKDCIPIIKIYSKSGESNCQIFVEDNGIGFEEKYLDRIFSVFQRLHGRDEYEGSGIGLSVCKKIVERHNGEITAKSVEGKGTTFIITLPTKQLITTHQNN